MQSKTINNLLADTTMPPSQLLTALEHVWSTLADVPHKAIAGGLAVSFWGYPRSTRDVDLAILLPKVNPLQQLDQLLAVNREALDFIYLQHWSKQLGVQIPVEK